MDEREARICVVLGMNVPVMGEENERRVVVEEVCKTLKGTKTAKALVWMDADLII